jgi:hypothetical protein
LKYVYADLCGKLKKRKGDKQEKRGILQEKAWIIWFITWMKKAYHVGEKGLSHW